jgi:hypothetical protein
MNSKIWVFLEKGEIKWNKEEEWIGGRNKVSADMEMP